MTPFNRYRRWLDSPDIDEATKEELHALADDVAEITERFYTELEFGTAGLRGILGAGDNRMNVYIVRKASEGLARYLKSGRDKRRRAVCIAYDSRHCSELFARETACVLAGHGIKVYLFSTLHSVPQLSFSLRHLNCDAGVVITASHNPPKYNGYKVYGPDGGQVPPATALKITDYIRQVKGFKTAYRDYDEALATGDIQLVGEELDRVYYDSAKTLLVNPELLSRHGSELAIVYTPLHGSGRVPVTRLLSEVGISRLYVVPEQAEPDGAFPTVSAPNPENPEAFTLAKRLADEKHADLILATDPDADRLGVAVRGADGWQVLTGNQIGSILIHYLLSAMKQKGTLPPDGLVLRSVVSTHLADAICSRFGVALEEVMTGFRFISERIESCARNGSPHFIFGFEESYGFLAGGYARDKDSISSAMLLCEASVSYARRGMTLYDALHEIYREYGYCKESVKSYTLEGKAGIERIANSMGRLRAATPGRIGDRAVLSVQDFLSDPPLGTPKSNVLRFTLEGGAWIVVRPSGTEPKLKLYIGAEAPTEPETDSALASLMTHSDTLLKELLFD